MFIVLNTDIIFLSNGNVVHKIFFNDNYTQECFIELEKNADISYIMLSINNYYTENSAQILEIKST